jgi:UDP-2,3-diacylglucosamine pyrophosphatase LpxH
VTGYAHTGLVVDVSDGPLFLISDVHAGALDPGVDMVARNQLSKLLRLVNDSNGRLIILGDLFDFWQESHNSTPKQLDLWLGVFEQHSRSDTPTILITGNHDHWAGPALAKRGFIIVRDHVMVTTSTQPWLLLHGDGLPHEGLHLKRGGLNRKFRNPFFNALFRLLPMPSRVHIMRAFSNYRKQHGVDRAEHTRIYDHLSNWLKSSDFQGLVYGHTHEKDFRNIDGKYLVNTGTFFSDAAVMLLDGDHAVLTTVDELEPPFQPK